MVGKSCEKHVQCSSSVSSSIPPGRNHCFFFRMSSYISNVHFTRPGLIACSPSSSCGVLLLTGNLAHGNRIAALQSGLKSYGLRANWTHSTSEIFFSQNDWSFLVQRWGHCGRLCGEARSLFEVTICQQHCHSDHRRCKQVISLARAWIILKYPFKKW